MREMLIKSLYLVLHSANMKKTLRTVDVFFSRQASPWPCKSLLSDCWSNFCCCGLSNCFDLLSLLSLAAPTEGTIFQVDKFFLAKRTQERLSATKKCYRTRFSLKSCCCELFLQKHCEWQRLTRFTQCRKEPGLQL